MPAIPQPLWDKLLAYLRAGHTGQITLHVTQGRITRYELTESGPVIVMDEPRTPRQNGKVYEVGTKES